MNSKQQMMSTALNLLMLFALVASFSACSSDDDFEEKECLSLASRVTRSAGEPRYPSVDEMASSMAVVPNMDLAWSNTLSACKPGERCEYGFIISSYDGVTGIYCGTITAGPIADNSTNPAKNRGTISLTLPKDKSDLCGFFHTHTSYEYFHFTHSRLAGPSTRDYHVVDSLGIPGLLYDYDVDSVRNGDPKDSPKFLYKYGPDRRLN